MFILSAIKYLGLSTILFSICLAQNWETFQKKHLLNPKLTAESQYHHWNTEIWNTWLKTRLADYGKKVVNSVIVSTPTLLLKDFSSTNATHTAGPDFRWSKTKLKTYVLNLIKSEGYYEAYYCDSLYVLARLDNLKRPIHYHGYATTKLSSGTLPLNLNSSCTKIEAYQARPYPFIIGSASPSRHIF